MLRNIELQFLHQSSILFIFCILLNGNWYDLFATTSLVWLPGNGHRVIDDIIKREELQENYVQLLKVQEVNQTNWRRFKSKWKHLKNLILPEFFRTGILMIKSTLNFDKILRVLSAHKCFIQKESVLQVSTHSVL